VHLIQDARTIPILRYVMRVLPISIVVLALAVPAVLSTTVWAANRPLAGSLSIEGGRGTVVIRGTGPVVGRLGKGDLQIVDLSPNDQWNPRINGAPLTRTTMRGKDVNFFIPGGRYRLTVHGDGISISARGAGYAVVKAKDATDSGTIAVGDGTPIPLPEESQRLTFGGGVAISSTNVLP
jgi:hypothetical protein